MGWTSARSGVGWRTMPNALIHETSPYLLQHAHNPVDWRAWGEEAFARARAEDKLVFLSVGYSTCHWCHVMERESFENERVAEVMNHHFINVKVDREERPDIDATYMAYRAGDDRAGRLADERVAHAGRQTGFRRHLFPAG